MKGTLIVLEGTDGSGKSTQFARLCRRLEEEGYPFRRLVFPQYQEESSALIRMYLAGEFGEKPGDVNPYAASAFYAVDRYASWKKDWQAWYESGGLVLADRYTTSNAVHQTGKLPPAERPAFLRWLAEFEYDRLGLPRPDLVLYLDLPTQQALELLHRRQEETHDKGDIHETDRAYLASCRSAALEAAESYGWKKVSCLDEEQELRGIEEIQEELWRRVYPLLERKGDPTWDTTSPK